MAKVPGYWPFKNSGAVKGTMAIAGWKGEGVERGFVHTLRFAKDFEALGPLVLTLALIFALSGILVSCVPSLLKITQFKDLARLIHTTGLFLGAVCYLTAPAVLLLVILCPLTMALS